MRYPHIAFFAFTLFILPFTNGCVNRDSVPPDVHGKVLVSTLNQVVVFDIKSLLADKQALPQIILNSGDEYRHPTWSPNGAQITTGYLSGEESRPTKIGPGTYYHLAVFNADGTGKGLLFNDSNNYEFPTWSPDGKSIAFISYPNGIQERVGKLCFTQLPTNNKMCVDKIPAQISKPAWSFDGKYVTYADQNSSIVIYNIERNEASKLPAAGYSPVFHPDGRHIFFVQKDFQALRSINIDGTAEQVIRKGFVDYLVNISKDGQYLLYAGGGFKWFIVPGPEYTTLELLDLKTLKILGKTKFSVIYGASWAE